MSRAWLFVFNTRSYIANVKPKSVINKPQAEGRVNHVCRTQEKKVQQSSAIKKTMKHNCWMNEWMMHLYSDLFCIAVYPKRFTIMWGGGGLLNHHQCAASTWMMRCCHRTTAPVRSPHTSYRWRGGRVIEPIKWMGIIRSPWLTRASGGNLARTPGLHPTLYKKCHGIFNDHRQSGPQFNISSSIVSLSKVMFAY